MKLLPFLLLWLPAPVLAVNVQRVQGGCEPAAVSRLVRLSDAKLERCGATGTVVIHIAANGRVERVDASRLARSCWKSRTKTWRVRMREARKCRVVLGTNDMVPAGR